MDIQIDRGGAITVARVSGELIGEDVERFTEELTELVSGEGSALAVELSELELVDSNGLAALMNLVTRARLSEGNVVLVSPSAFVAGIFSVTRLDTWFDICNTLDEAKRKLE